MRAPTLTTLLLLLACAGPGADMQDALRAGRVDLALEAHAREGHRGSLAPIAEQVLVNDARGAQAATRERALAGLRAAGTHARGALRRLVSEADVSGMTRSRALSLLAALGDGSARSELRALLDSSDAAVLAAAVTALDPGAPADRPRIRESLRSGFAAVRVAVLDVLHHGPADASLRDEVLRVAAGDPDAAVRVAALGTLPALLGSASDQPAMDAIEGRLEDGERPVRVAAMAALVRVDRPRAARRFFRDHSGTPTAEGIDVARLLLASGTQDAGPLDLIARALGSHDHELRARAATAASTLGVAQLRPRVRERLAQEPARSIRLALALALEPVDPIWREHLVQLSAQQDVVGTQAVAELARRGDLPAIESLVARLKLPDAAVRRVVVRVLARDLGRTREVARALADGDASVRIAAAAAILVGAR